MNSWVYAGFETTYASLGVEFDKNYYESETYLLGKDEIQKGLKEGVFLAKEDGSVWIDLTEEGLDEKILLRSDGTAVYMTQDIGTAIQRYVDFGLDGMVYTVGNEQEYHFKVLFLVLAKLGHQWAERLYHLSYGMVNLPSGKMKSREGTVVDADDLIDEMKQTAQQISEELGKTDGLGAEEKQSLYSMVGWGPEIFILKVDPPRTCCSTRRNPLISMETRVLSFSIPTHVSAPFSAKQPDRNYRRPNGPRPMRPPSD